MAKSIQNATNDSAITSDYAHQCWSRYLGLYNSRVPQVIIQH